MRGNKPYTNATFTKRVDILNGIATHGSFSIPTHPASHGCIRIPMFAAKELNSLMPTGMEVVIYGHQESAVA